jgi:hypothetical protein
MAVTRTVRGIGNYRNNHRITYVSDVSIAGEAQAEIEIVPDKRNGTITEFTFESLSPDCDVYISEITGAAKTDAETRVQVDGIALGYSRSFKANPASYTTEATGVQKLFVNIVNNSATATGPWTLVLRYEQ